MNRRGLGRAGSVREAPRSGFDDLSVESIEGVRAWGEILVGVRSMRPAAIVEVPNRNSLGRLRPRAGIVIARESC